LITDIKLYPESESPSSSDGWKKVPLSLRKGIMGAPALYLWYQLGKTSGDMTAAERSNIVTELDVLYGDDIPWYGFEKLEPATMIHRGDVESTWLTMRRGVKRTHFSRLAFSPILTGIQSLLGHHPSTSLATDGSRSCVFFASPSHGF
jgi:hypothetical protein